MIFHRILSVASSWLALLSVAAFAHAASAGIDLSGSAAPLRSADASAKEVVLHLGGTPAAFAYISSLLTRTLEQQGHSVRVHNVGNFPTTRLEVMLEHGEISAFILGRTPQRDGRFLPVNVGMTDDLVNQRILFIPKGAQVIYDKVQTLEDFRQLGLVAALGVAWADNDIWVANDLPLRTLGGDWKRLYEMVASQDRGMDYLPRGSHEMAEEWRLHPDLDVERNLVLVYDQDHIMYVSPTDLELHTLLQGLLVQARDSGLIAELAAEFFADVKKPPVSLEERRVIDLRLPRSPQYPQSWAIEPGR